MAETRVGTAVLELRTDNAPLDRGLKEAEQRTEGFKQKAEKAGQTLGSFRREVRNTAQVLSGMSALLSVVVRGNEEWQDRLEKATVALSIGATVLNLYRHATQLAATNTLAFRNALFLTAGTAGVAAAALTGLYLIVKKLDETFGKLPAERLHHSLSGATARMSGEVLERAAASAARFTTEGRGLQHRQRELQSQVEDTTGAVERATDVMEQKAAADLKAAKAAAELARRQRELREATENETNDLLLADAAMREAEEQTFRLDDETKTLIFDARDAARVEREMTAATQTLDDAIADLVRSMDLLEIQQAADELGGAAEDFFQRANKIKRSGGVDAFTVIEKSAAQAATTLIQQAKEVADAVGPEIAMAMLDRSIPGFEKFGEAGNKAIKIILQALSELGQEIPDVVGEIGIITDKSFKLADALEDRFEDAFANLITGAKSFSDVFLDIINSILSAFGRHVGEAAFSYLFPSMAKRQHGGPLAAFQPAIVGERGQELWIPRVAGQIIPHNDLVAPGGGMQIFVDARGAQRGVSAEIQRAIAEMGEGAVRASVAKVQDQVLRGGSSRNLLRR